MYIQPPPQKKQQQQQNKQTKNNPDMYNIMISFNKKN